MIIIGYITCEGYIRRLYYIWILLACLLLARYLRNYLLILINYSSYFNNCSFVMINKCCDLEVIQFTTQSTLDWRGEHRAHAVSPDHKFSHGDSKLLFLTITATKVQGRKLQSWPRPTWSPSDHWAGKYEPKSAFCAHIYFPHSHIDDYRLWVNTKIHLQSIESINVIPCGWMIRCWMHVYI